MLTELNNIEPCCLLILQKCQLYHLDIIFSSQHLIPFCLFFFISSGFIFMMWPQPHHTKAHPIVTHLTNLTPSPHPRLCFRGNVMTPGLQPRNDLQPLPRRPALMSSTKSSRSRGLVGKRGTTGERLTVSVDVKWSLWWHGRIGCCLF